MEIKKIIIGLVVLLLAIIAFFIVNFSPKPQKVSHPQNDQLQAINFDRSKNKLYYLEPKGNNLKSWDLNSNKVELIIDFETDNIGWIEYSPDNNFALANRTNPRDSIRTQTWLIDLNAKKILKELPNNIAALSWRSDSKKIAYHLSDLEGVANDLVVSNPDGSNSQLITPFD